MWIETKNNCLLGISYAVTPHGGVWIETLGEYAGKAVTASLPTGECGLKRETVDDNVLRYSVTPHGGVWIETATIRRLSLRRVRHSPRGSVD